MTLHNPGSIKLPPLEIDKMDALEKMENNRCISNFIDSKLLLDCEFNKLYSDIQEKSEKIFYYIKLIKEDNFEWKNRRNLISKAISTYYFEKDKEHGAFSSIEDLSREDILYLIKRYGWIEDKDKYDDNRLLEARGGENTALKNEIMSLSHEIQDLLNEFEKKKGKKLNIISHTLINFCDNCNNIISLGRFRPSKCYCGDKIKNASI